MLLNAMISNYSMNSCEQDAIYAYLYGCIAGKLTRDVKNGNTDHYLPAWHDGRIRAEYNDRRQAARYLW